LDAIPPASTSLMAHHPLPPPLSAARRDLAARYWPLACMLARAQLDRRGQWVDGDELRSLAGWVTTLAAAAYRPGPMGFPAYLRRRLARLRVDAHRATARRRRGWRGEIDVAEFLDRRDA
jgi:hypothetical protein